MADGLSASNAELDRIDEFTGRFPGWAETLSMAQSRIGSLERAVETLSDRLSHDPNLATSLHEVLSTAASIRSTASILANTSELEPQWRDRFHRNLHQDSTRLSDSSKALVRYLDDTTANDMATRRTEPRDAAEALFVQHDHHFPGLEDGTQTPDDIIATAEWLNSTAAKSIARELLRDYVADANALPLADLTKAIKTHGSDVPSLVQHFDLPVATVLRRIASLPPKTFDRSVGLVICDASGAFLFRKLVDGFSVPQFGASCPRWPLFGAMSRPMAPVHKTIRQLGRSPTSFDCYAVAEPQASADFGADLMLRATMLIVPVEDADGATILEVGTNCRICQKTDCLARREPSALSEAF